MTPASSRHSEGALPDAVRLAVASNSGIGVIREHDDVVTSEVEAALASFVKCYAPFLD